MNAFSILFTDAFNNENVGELTNIRNLSSMPFGGRYRLIDFILSAMVGANIRDVGVVTRNKFNSLADHIGTGKDWDLNRKNGGLKLLMPYAEAANSDYRNKFEALCSISTYIDSMLPEYCILADSNIVCNIDFNAIFQEHVEKEADMTVLYHETNEVFSDDTEVMTDENGRIVDALYHSSDSMKNCNTLMKVYILNKRLLKYIIDKGLTFGWQDINRDYIAQNLHTAKIYGYKYTGYCKIIKNIRDYYVANMDLLNIDVRNEIFRGKQKIHTKIKDSVPTKYGEDCLVRNSLVADGCKIEGRVENCILFRDVVIKKGAQIRNSIIMQGSAVGEDAIVCYTIADKNVTISPGREMIGSPTLPMAIGKYKAV